MRPFHLLVRQNSLRFSCKVGPFSPKNLPQASSLMSRFALNSTVQVIRGFELQFKAPSIPLIDSKLKI